jgi:ATP:corrinoid adenosyltransferase
LENAKYKYSEPNQHAAKQVIASFLNIEMSSVTIKGEHNAALVKQEGPRNVTVAASSQSTVMVPPSRAPSIPPQQQQQQQQQVPFASAPTNHFIAHPLMVPSHSQQYQPPLFPNQAGTTMAAPPFYGHAAMTMPPSVAMPFPNGPLPLASQPAMVTSGSFVMPSPVPSAPMSAVSSATRTSSTTIVPTAEQEEIYQHAKPPTPLDTNFKVRITAGAGAGKTTTVLDVATRAARLGHNHITYVTFAKAAAVDGARRINEALSGMPNPPTIEARTLHSAAMKVLSEERKEDSFTEDHNRLVDDEGLQNFIKRVCEREVQDFLSHAREEINSRNKKDATKGASMLESAERQVLFFIFKTFATFCRSPYTLEQLKDPMFKYRDYYPAKKFHCEGDGEKQGFPKQVYSSKLSKYADIACLVWEAASQQGIRSYDLEMKRAQLKALRIPGSLLLVDESQDMDGCQVDWIAKQCNHGAHVYIVGDAAQTIYSFRGAKSKYMVNIKGAVDFKLTKSWRFGPNIANVANVVLFCKHKSKQTQRDNPTWQ